MSQIVTLYRILVASPSDVLDERTIVAEVTQSWNADHSLGDEVMLESVNWKTHSTPQMGERAQSILNKQLVGNCDILIAIFRNRLGTPTEKAESGTAEEIREFISARKPAIIYFSKANVDYEKIDREEKDYNPSPLDQSFHLREPSQNGHSSHRRIRYEFKKTGSRE